MKKIIGLVSLSLMCCFLQGCSSEQSAELTEGVEASLETVGVSNWNLEDGKFSFGLDEVNFLLKVNNDSDSIYEIEQEKLEKIIKPINQDGEIEGSLEVDASGVEKVKPNTTEGVIVRVALKDLEIKYDSIGLMINEEKFLVSPSDERIQVLRGFTLTRTSATLDNEDISIDFNIHELRNKDNIAFSERIKDPNILEFDYNVTNKTDRMLILPKVVIIQADNYKTNNSWLGSNLLDSDNFNNALSEAKEKDSIIADNNIIKYIKEGQDLTLEEINKYSAVLADNGIYMNEEEEIIQEMNIIKPEEKIQLKNNILSVDGAILKVQCQYFSGF